jgi:hypothetical protein
MLSDTRTPEETIFLVKKNALLIFDVLGYGHQNIHQEAKIFCFESTLTIPRVEAPTYEDALNNIQNQNVKSNFFEYDGFTFACMNPTDFKSLSTEIQQDFVHKFIDSLSLKTIEVQELAAYSLTCLATMLIIEQSNIIDPGLSDLHYFEGRETEEKEISSITFEPNSIEKDLFFTSIDDNELVSNIIKDIPESIFYDIQEQPSSSIVELSYDSGLEDSSNYIADDSDPNFYIEDINSYDENLDIDPYENFDLL